MAENDIEKLSRLLRYDIITSTTTAGSGHPTSSLSAVELMATLFFGGYLKYDLHNPQSENNDRVIFSKGHASPLLYSLYHVAGALKYEELLKLRTFDSPLEGHPTPRFKYVDVATGSLGQGLSVGVGMALGIRSNVLRFKLQVTRIPKVWVLVGDSELAEGQNWEAMEIASHYKLNNLVAILDMNRVGQRGETMAGWDETVYQKRAEAFGWNTIVIQNGHNIDEIKEAFDLIEEPKTKQDDKPIMVIAKTVKGKGVSFMEDKDGWHGKAIPKDKLDTALKEIGDVDVNTRATICHPELVSGSAFSKQQMLKQVQQDNSATSNDCNKQKEILLRLGAFIKQNHIHIPDVPRSILNVPSYKHGDLIAPRQAYGDALLGIADKYPEMVVLDAEMANSLYTEEFGKKYPERYFQMYIAEQNMISAAVGLDKMGYMPFAASFGSFMSRAFDQIRMAQYSDANINVVGSHVGVSIGQDGSSQMALEDLAMMRSILNSIVLYPSDAVSTYKLVELMACYHRFSYLRLTRKKLPVIYDSQERFWVGGSKVLRKNPKDIAVIFTGGYTLHEALKAYEELKKEDIHVAVVDLYSVKPIDVRTIQHFAQKVKNVIVVEDHYPAGGLGEAVAQALLANNQLQISNTQKNYKSQTSKNSLEIENCELKISFTHLCVNRLPRSGSPEDLLRYEGLDSAAIVKAVRKCMQS